MQLFPKMPSRMANSVDPDQMAPSGAVWSGSTLFAYAILSDILGCQSLGHLLQEGTFFWILIYFDNDLVFYISFNIM